jgi:hypothetical protein
MIKQTLAAILTLASASASAQERPWILSDEPVDPARLGQCLVLKKKRGDGPAAATLCTSIEKAESSKKRFLVQIGDAPFKAFLGTFECVTPTRDEDILGLNPPASLEGATLCVQNVTPNKAVIEVSYTLYRSAQPRLNAVELNETTYKIVSVKE